MPSHLSIKEKNIIKFIKKFDTPTIANSLEIINPNLRGRGFTQKTMLCSNPKLKPIVGFAKTAVITSRKKKNTDINKNREAYYEYMFKGKDPKICVIEDKNNINTIGAWWGEINSQIHSKFGFEGAVTNGAIRDIDMIYKNFQILAGEIRPGHGYIQIQKIDCTVEIFNMQVNPNDLIHADYHGAVVIKRINLQKLPEAINKLLRKEKIIFNFFKINKDFSIKQFKHEYKKFMGKNN